MTEVSAKNFGYLVAYVIPGFVIVASLGLHSETIRSWLSPLPEGAPTVGGFLFVTVASVAAGMVVSAVRWLILDNLHHWTGVPKCSWSISALAQRQAAFETLVEYHYRHYLFYGNGLVALLVTMPLWLRHALAQTTAAILLVGVCALGTLLFLASRDTYQKYVIRSNQLLTSIPE